MNRLNKKGLSFWIIVVPLGLALIYLTLIAADRYVSEAKISVKDSGDMTASAATGIATLLTGANPTSREETLYLMEYIHSLDMLNHLESKLNLRAAYGDEKIDLAYRLWGSTSQEWFLRYYRNRVEVVFDELTGLLTVRVQGFEPEFAQAINREILGQSERFINEISHRLAREQLAFAEGELRQAADRMQAAKGRLLSFQNKHGLFDPLVQAQAGAGLGVQLAAEIARKEAELTAMLGYLQDTAPQVVMRRNEIAALKSQARIEQQKVASGGGQRLNTLAAQFQSLTLEAVFAEEAYKAALAAVEATRIESGRKIKSLVVIQSPSKPEIAEYPQRLYILATLLVALTLLYGIVRLAIATVKDHQD
jgi:capsular polysaccharide transport system permease protein